MRTNEPSARYSPHGEGYVKVYRKLLSSAVFQNEKLLKVWIWCLIRANWTESPCFFEGEEITLRKGEFITGRFTGSEQCNMNPKTFYNQLVRLEECKQIKLDSDNRKTRVTVLNYEAYQGDMGLEWTPKGQPADNRRTTEGQLVDTDKEVKKLRSKEVNNGKPASFEEVELFFKTKGYPPGEAISFFHHFESNGWVIGRARTPCKNWHSAAATWINNWKKWGNDGRSNGSTGKSQTGGVRAEPSKYAKFDPPKNPV